MDRSGRYESPHSFNDINQFIKESFNGHKGLTPFTQEEHERWLSYEHYGKEFDYTSEIYGCGGHGGSWVVMDMIEKKNEDVLFSVTYQAYADYAKFIKANKYTVVFDTSDVPRLLYIEVSDNTGRKAVTNGI